MGFAIFHLPQTAFSYVTPAERLLAATAVTVKYS
jgi:hypothetical protein